MRVTVKLFAILRDRAGVSGLTLDLPRGVTASAATQAVAQQHPAIRDLLPRIALAVNQEYVSTDVVLNDGDELALIPPVSGGSGVDDAAQLVLDYASKSTDGTPDWYARAEELIESGAAPDKLRPLFRSGADAANYYAKSQARRFGTDRVTGKCIGCGIATPNVALVRWEVIISLRAMELAVAKDGHHATFTTVHSTCESCHARSFAATSKFALLRVLATSGIVGLFVLFSFTSLFSRARSARGSAISWPGVLAVAFLVASVAIDRTLAALARRSIPKAVAKLMHGRVQMQQYAPELLRRNPDGVMQY